MDQVLLRKILMHPDLHEAPPQSELQAQDSAPGGGEEPGEEYPLPHPGEAPLPAWDSSPCLPAQPSPTAELLKLALISEKKIINPS